MPTAREEVLYGQTSIATNRTASIKDRVRHFWEEHPCGAQFAEARVGTKLFFSQVKKYRYKHEGYIPEAANISAAKGLRVLEVGCGMGCDGTLFARQGAHYTGIDLTSKAITIARRHFRLYGLRGAFKMTDAEALPFADGTFDLVYSYGVLHHTPNTERALHEVHRVLKPGGQAIIMLYHRDSYYYWVVIRFFRRLRLHLLRANAGVQLLRLLRREPLSVLRADAESYRRNRDSYLSPGTFLAHNTDGLGNPISKVFSASDVQELFKHFDVARSSVRHWKRCWVPLIGNRLPESLLRVLERRWGWHLWIYARKAKS